VSGAWSGGSPVTGKAPTGVADHGEAPGADGSIREVVQ
jgi:hypothetical protein